MCPESIDYHRNLAIAYTGIVYAPDRSDVGWFCLRVSGFEKFNEDSPQVTDDLAPHAGEYIIRKTQPSVFFSTGLAARLVSKQIDTLIVTGATTSGCVRASAVDSISYNFRTIVATDCVCDRAFGLHEANLFDMGQKYADLKTGGDVVTYLEKA